MTWRAGTGSATIRSTWLIAVTGSAALMVVAVSADGAGPLTAPKAVVLGVVEGLTEFLPVSSTGHLLVAQRLLGLGATSEDEQAAAAYVIAVQLGAILAVVGVCRHRVAQIMRGIAGRDCQGRRLAVSLLVAFAPAGAVGVLVGDQITDRLFAVWPVVAAWIVGGVFLLWWQPRPGMITITALSTHRAAMIGGAQLLAFWPGTSRSLVTIVATVAVGATIAAAVEFSFLLGLMTLGAATALDLTRHGDVLVAAYGWQTPLLGAIAAFISAGIAARWLLNYLRSRTLAVFGWYRLAIAATTATLIAIGAIPGSVGP